MDQVVMKPKGWLKPPHHSRTRFDESELRHLAANIEAIGLLNPIVALPTGEIIAGHRRWKAAMLNERITEVAVRIENDPLTARQLRIRRISENLQRSDLAFFDKYLECRGFRDDEPGITAKEIAELLHVDSSTITRYLCLDHVIEAVKQAAAEERISMKAAYEISKAPQEAQEALLTEALGGSAGQVAKARKQRNGTVPAAERLKRAKFPRPSGTVISLTGDLTMEEAADELSELAAEMRKEGKHGTTLKTFMAKCHDRAEAGV